jgi:hypothetical protein
MTMLQALSATGSYKLTHTTLCTILLSNVWLPMAVCCSHIILILAGPATQGPWLCACGDAKVPPGELQLLAPVLSMLQHIKLVQEIATAVHCGTGAGHLQGMGWEACCTGEAFDGMSSMPKRGARQPVML